MNELVVLNWQLLGAKLALLDSEKQAQFLKGFALEFDQIETHMSKEIQLLSVNDALDVKAKTILEKYLPCLWFKSF